MAALVAATLFNALATVRADTIYVSNAGSGTITMFAPNGAGTIFAAGLNAPKGLALDGAGNLYVAITGDNKIMKFTPGGVGSLFANTGLNYPGSIAFDSSGNLYVANLGSYDGAARYYHSYIEKFTPGGVGTFFADATGSGLFDVACDGAQNVYATYPNNNQVVKFTPNGVPSVFASVGLNIPQGLAFDREGNLYVGNGSNGYVSNPSDNTIEKFSPGGQDLGRFSSGGLNGPAGLAFDSGGTLYVANFRTPNGYIETFNPAGFGSVFASGLNLPAFVAIVPEPSTWALVGLYLTGMLALRDQRKRESCRSSQ